MKIGIVHTSYLQKGGEDLAVEQECRLLYACGCQVSDLGFYNPDGKYRQVVTLLMTLGSPVSWKRINRWLDDEAPDLVHIHDWHFSASPSIIRAAKKKGIPVVLTLYDFRLLCPSASLLSGRRLFTACMRGGFPWKAVFKRSYRGSLLQTFWLSLTLWLHRESGTWKGVDRYIVLTAGARDILLASDLGFNPSQFVVKPGCLADIREPVSEREKHFLYIGRLSAEKGLLILLKAFALSPYRLTIMGDGPLLPSVRQYAEHFGNIEYKGPADRATIPGECARCTALVFPSGWCEGNAMTIIVALACGTPVIASRAGAMKDMITHGVNGLHFERGNAHDLCRTLEQWQRLSGEERQAYSERARESYLRQYTPEKNIADLLAVYESILESRQDTGKQSPASASEKVFSPAVKEPEMTQELETINITPISYSPPVRMEIFASLPPAGCPKIQVS